MERRRPGRRRGRDEDPSRPSKVLRVEKGSCAYHYIGSVYGDFLDNCSSGMGPKSNLGNWQSSF